MSSEEQPAQSGKKTGEILSVKDWVITLIILAIPFVNLIMLFVWAFGGGTPEVKANYAKAALIIMAIMFGLYILIFLIAGAAMMGSM
ncbi:MAG: hypothetical protein ABEH38_02895 [Flavobacteriales bacterium]